jgi:hypothetical protein
MDRKRCLRTAIFVAPYFIKKLRLKQWQIRKKIQCTYQCMKTVPGPTGQLPQAICWQTAIYVRVVA